MSRLKAPQRRRQLLDVATKLFAEFGYDATTTAAIAEAAEVTEPILYRHFDSKQELFIAITREMSLLTLQHWQDLITGTTDPAEQIRRIARQFPEHIKKLSSAYHVIHNALTTSRDKKVQAVLREHYTQIEKFFTDLIKSGQRDGAFRAIDPRVPAWQLIHAGMGFAMIALNLPQIQQSPVEEAIDFILAGMQREAGK